MRPPVANSLQVSCARRRLAAASGGYVLTGFAATLLKHSRIVLQSGHYTVTGITEQSAFNRPVSVSKLCVAVRRLSGTRGSSRQRMLPSFQPAFAIFAAIGDFIMLDALRKSGGGAIAVPDDQMISCTKEVGSAEGVFTAPEGGACYAALKTLLAAAPIKDIPNCAGHSG